MGRGRKPRKGYETSSDDQPERAVKRKHDGANRRSNEGYFCTLAVSLILSSNFMHFSVIICTLVLLFVL